MDKDVLFNKILNYLHTTQFGNRISKTLSLNPRGIDSPRPNHRGYSNNSLNCVPTSVGPEGTRLDILDTGSIDKFTGNHVLEVKEYTRRLSDELTGMLYEFPLNPKGDSFIRFPLIPFTVSKNNRHKFSLRSSEDDLRQTIWSIETMSYLTQTCSCTDSPPSLVTLGRNSNRRCYIFYFRN